MTPGLSIRWHSLAPDRTGFQGRRASITLRRTPRRAAVLLLALALEPLLLWPAAGAGGEAAGPAIAEKKDAPSAKSSKEAPFDLEARRRSHWAWQPIRPAALPAVRDRSWPRNPIDSFVLARLEEKGLRPAPPAPKEVLLRRLHFALLGLPPSPEEMAEFLADSAAGWLERVVDRLLASPRFGERWARHWLDLVRYAETLGHEFDYAIPNAWRYRDYVIRAFNEDLPYDRFVTEHLAGDLLADPRRDPREGFNESLIATGFFWLGQQVHSPVDVRLHQADVIDNQIDVLSQTFLGLTVACARCHDHKFDAISTRDYYALYGILESTRYGQRSIDPPERTAGKARELLSLKDEIRRTLGPVWKEEARKLPALLLASRRGAGAALPAGRPFAPWLKLAALPGEPASRELASAWRSLLEERSQAVGKSPGAGGDRGAGGELALESWLADGDAFSGGPRRPGEFAAGGPESPIAEMITEPCVHSGLLSRRLQGALRSPTFPIDRRFLHLRAWGRETRINVVVDNFTIIRDPIYGSLRRVVNGDSPGWLTVDLAMWKGHQAYIELCDQTTADLSDDAGRWGRGERAYLALSDVIFSNEHSPPAPGDTADPFQLLGEEPPASLGELSARYGRAASEAAGAWGAGGALSQSQASLLACLISGGLLGSPEGRSGPASERLALLLKRYHEVESSIPEPVVAPAAVEGSGLDERVFVRGNPATPGERVGRRFLEAISGSAQPAIARGSGRLELAQRITDPSDPFLARVMVNRVWRHLFGRGLVPVTDNFGALGRPPSHPELLDWLGAWYSGEGRWSTKRLIRLLVTSAAYGMASEPVERASEEADPDGALLSRMPLRRLEAEAIRDSILAVSGRLDTTPFGPPVAIHLTEFMDGRGRPASSGPLDGAGRRSIYLEVRRNFLSPLLRAFDAPVPFTTTGDRSASNVPALALILMNDPFVIEEAHLWARREISGPARPPGEVIRAMYLRSLARPPSPKEIQEAVGFLEEEALSRGFKLQDRPADETLWADFSQVMFNLKEFIFVP